MVIDIHGGPEAQFQPYFQGQTNYYMNELGIALICPNIRGSSGYGKEYLKLDNGYLRENSYKDIGALLDWIKTQPNLDADRVLVTGASYGGHMALAVAANYSDRIRAAIDIYGPANLVTFLENTAAYRQDLRRCARAPAAGGSIPPACSSALICFEAAAKEISRLGELADRPSPAASA